MYRRLFLQGLLYIQLFFRKNLLFARILAHGAHLLPNSLDAAAKKRSLYFPGVATFFFSEKMPAVLQIVGRADAGAAQLWELERPLQKRVGEDDVDHGRF